jgi:uncharacterized integral membrane protein
MGILKGIVIILLLAAAIGFAVNNDEAVSLRYYFGLESQPLPLFLWAFLSLLAGVILAGIVAFFAKIGLHAKVRRFRKNLADLEKKRNDLKTSLPSIPAE